MGAFDKEVSELWRFKVRGAFSSKFSLPLVAKTYLVRENVLEMQEWHGNPQFCAE